MEVYLIGKCLCGTVKFSVADRFKAFYLCHCKQCQQLTGSAFASNIFTGPDNID
ncbi:GFA family protein [Sinobacterium caligoides]|uniref:GFA family protein n=1 Tax=Sinobacterium caligoides TaxID=933926 RepID=UPI000F4D252F